MPVASYCGHCRIHESIGYRENTHDHSVVVRKTGLWLPPFRIVERNRPEDGFPYNGKHLTGNITEQLEVFDSFCEFQRIGAYLGSLDVDSVEKLIAYLTGWLEKVKTKRETASFICENCGAVTSSLFRLIKKGSYHSQDTLGVCESCKVNSEIAEQIETSIEEYEPPNWTDP